MPADDSVQAHGRYTGKPGEVFLRNTGGKFGRFYELTLMRQLGKLE